ncbi:hypothetical protein K435DRAFT_868006 [Dendrothele bispora CBS 962.96]|uniref:Uncharacterized protein n=1 Tax=Dendrothele bispora (strain CBS 962.96) TaxID=1314807 RepID=A0A4S8LCP3_DENBC|nr:hypothetical protein K435DRAFT_868006 [Dendrothele bispora CBS 962.96]
MTREDLRHTGQNSSSVYGELEHVNTPQAILRLLPRLRQGLRPTVFSPYVSYYSLLGVVLALRLPSIGMSTPSKAYTEALFKGISSPEPTHWQYLSPEQISSSSSAWIVPLSGRLSDVDAFLSTVRVHRRVLQKIADETQRADHQAAVDQAVIQFVRRTQHSISGGEDFRVDVAYYLHRRLQLLNNLNVAPPPPTTFFTAEECTPTPPPTPFEEPTPTDSGFIPSRPPSVTTICPVVPPVHLSVTNPELSNIPSSTTQEIPGASSPEVPASTMSAKPAMPVPKGQGAPTLSAESAKDPELVVEYIESVEALLKRSNITDDATKIEWLLRYLDLAVRRMWKMLFDQLKAEVKTYQACRDLLATYYPEIDEEAQNTLARFRKSLREFRDISETDERGLGVYRMYFDSGVKILPEDKITDREKGELFLERLDSDFRARIIDRLFTLGKEIKNEKGGVKDPEHM